MNERTLNPWLSIWRHPRATTRQILAGDPGRNVWLLAALAGIAHGFSSAGTDNAGDEMGLMVIVMTSVIGGAISGVLGLWLGSHVVRWTGSWIRGRATLTEVRGALAWSGVPTIWTLPVWLLAIALFGQPLFTKAGVDLSTSGGLAIVALVIFVGLSVVAIWHIVVSLKCLAEAQGFSAWRALGNLLLAFLVLTALLFAVVLTVSLVLTLLGVDAI